VALEPEGAAARGHSARVAALSRRLALAIGLTPEEAELVALAGRLHDIGAIGAAAAELMGCRPAVGAQLVAPFDVLGVVTPMIRHHHERLDGSGYPDGLRGEAIPLGARIIAVADECDRLTAATGEAGPLPSHHAALAHLGRHARHALDTALIAAYIGRALP
jgi:HD-GYP domain-containing protein (c-di-GMP phosphodiesterase class II)